MSSILTEKLRKMVENYLMDCWGNVPLILSEGKGTTVIDTDGREYIDCTAQAWTLSLGHSHPKIMEAVKEQINKIATVFFAYQSVPMVMLAEKLVEITPKEFNKILFGLSGSDTIEGAMHLAMRYTKGQDFITLYHAYHGRTFATIGMSYTYPAFVSVKRGMEKLLPKPIRVPNPYCYRCYYGLEYPKCDLLCAKFVENALKHAADTKVAGLMLEPIQANGGQIVSPLGYLPEIRRICTQYDIPLIFDEIQTGIGRCGKMFAAEVFDVFPDILVIGKGLGAGFPVTAIITTNKYTRLEKGEWGFTHGGSPFACAAALAALNVLIEEKLPEHAAAMGEILLNGLNELRETYSLIGDVRGKGLMIGVEMVDNRDTKKPAFHKTQKFLEGAQEKGVLFGKSGVGPQGGNVVKIKPPLTITEREIGKVLGVFEDVLKRLK